MGGGPDGCARIPIFPTTHHAVLRFTSSVDWSLDLSVAGLARRHVRGFESEEISVDYMQISVKIGAVFSRE